jgi:hypothetical protein
MLRKVLTMAIVAGLLLLLGVALFRPATLFGVDAKAVANSLGGEVQHAHAKCIGQGSGRWRCALAGGNVAGMEYVVTVHRFGCWSGFRITRPGRADTGEQSVSGCIGLADLFGD